MPILKQRGQAVATIQIAAAVTCKVDEADESNKRPPPVVYIF